MIRFRFSVALIVLFLFSPVAFATQTSETRKQPVTVPASILDSYVGQYSLNNEPEIHLSFFHDGDQLYFESARIARTVLTAISNNTFSSNKGKTSWVFEKDATGAVTGLKRSADGGEAEAHRVSGTPEHNHFRSYTRREVMIPMRDGIQLHAVVLRPSDESGPFPFLMQRTPYGVDQSTSDQINERYTELAQSGYIFVMEDIRGRYKSQGSFVMMRPLANHSDLKAIDESTDAYDTITWLLKNVRDNNGRVGVIGTSYPGFLTAEAGIDPHSAVKAISPQAPMTDVWIGDDFFHNGAFRQTYGYDYALGMESSKESTFGKLKEDGYTYFLDAGSFAAACKKSGVSELPTWKAFLDNPAYDEYWRSRAIQYHEHGVPVPTLEVGGWWDQEDMWGPQAEYAAMEPYNQLTDPQHRVFLVLGPWNHGGWSETTRHLGALDFGAPTGDQFREQIEAPFFAYYLKDQPGFDLENTATFQTGTNRWMHYKEWPPKGTTKRDLYLGSGGNLTFEHPMGNAITSYISDPANPIPYRKRPIEATYAPGSKWYTWLVQDQRFLGDRKDIATWTTPPLDHNVTITGDVIADLFASTSGGDSDWVVKLIDVAPNGSIVGSQPSDGYELMIVDEIFRGRYRKSFDDPIATLPNRSEEYKFSLHGADHVFLQGHRIMVQVQSSWFPLYDRNPQTFVPNIMSSTPSAYKPAEEKIYGESHIELPIMP